ncbi:class I SAM-dependent methyltransferase [Novosphingobium mangrovi (ex Huang et al. 2023)]|uniref:Class I SAM-dependent methyltransferase n=1 Tax=Novosphingobium mangrovi (ex Huang et al. 2023) TaxID=2976432 RepID=A0ABT2I071_9SPHN|nr:class I SAM-dependent methyltransferase [Novosphingobium mangrovi (ex Huang et al. 2023)]MCT2398197.1 class I SAM-dependent methyltransferase [Novosphingobium mangrovi (ex Huang et al. 2023)]
MRLARALAQQLAHPRGMAGRLLGNAMDVANRRPLRLAVDLLAPARGEEILDAGCGTGAAMARMQARVPCHVTGVDASETMLDAARRKLGAGAECVNAPLEDLPFASARFDAVLALNVLYFNDADNGMLRSMLRVLRPGGRLVAYVTHRDTMIDWPFAREGLHRLYDAAGLREALVAAGFACGPGDVQEVAVTRSVKGLLAHAQR